MKKVRNRYIKNLHYLCLIAVIALGLMTIVGTGGGGGGGGEGTDTATVNESGEIEIEWDIPTTIISREYSPSGVLQAVTFYMNFEVISGSGDVQVTATIKDTPASEDTLDQHMEMFNVEEGTQYEVSVRVNVGGEGLCSALVSDVIIYSSPSASSTQETYIYPTLHTDNNNYCIGSYSIDEITVMSTVTSTEDADHILYVPSEYSTIQEAIETAREGDTIKIAAGTYNEEDLEVFGGLTLEGENGESTIIRGSGGKQIIKTSYDSDRTQAIVIKNVTIENGSGGIYDLWGHILELMDCIVENNNSTGINLYTSVTESSNSVATVSNCKIADNAGSGISGETVTISNSLIKNNSGDGVKADSVTITNTIIAHNTRGGIDCDNLDITYCTIYGNNNGIWAYSSEGTIKNSIIAMNTDYGIWDNDSSLTLSHINFHGNSQCNLWEDLVCDTDSASYEAIYSILTDPMFVDAENGNFRLQEGSWALTASDTDGEIGAYGNGGNPPD